MATELEVLELTEALFAETSADIILRTNGQRDKITSELRELMRVHRGSTVAAYLMEISRLQGKLPDVLPRRRIMDDDLRD